MSIVRSKKMSYKRLFYNNIHCNNFFLLTIKTNKKILIN